MALFSLLSPSHPGVMQEGGGSAGSPAWPPPWPLPQGLLGEVASEELLFSSRASMEGGVGLRKSFLRRGMKEKGARNF